MSEEQKKYLEHLLSPLGFLDKKDKIEEFLDFLMEKNQELNVVSRKLPLETIILEHVYDYLGGFFYFEPYKTITDLGSGGGFPGLLLGIVFPEKKINLVEKSPKKAEYLKEAIKKLELKNTNVYSLLVTDFKEKTDVFTCRAFKSTAEILQMTISYFKNGTPYVLFKGKAETIEQELKQIKGLKYQIKIEKICPEIKEKERNILFLEKE